MSSSSFPWSKDRATDGNEVECHSHKKLYTMQDHGKEFNGTQLKYRLFINHFGF